ncbi:MAG: 50S ribosome-binding GTPase, partial [Phycisphaerales bacterium]|nr:50S ribosome-binding GTPase [Phycisphaerales bacterium]
MPVPRIAIVGRPNVGKSSLLNMMAKRKVAIVDPPPGVTRDRVAVLVDLDSPDGAGPIKVVEVTDTGGYGAYTAEGERYNEIGEDLQSLTKDIESQISHAVSGADLILFAIDTQAGITPQDQQIAKMLRQQKLGDRQRGDDLVPVRVVATKCDGPSWETHA